MGDYIGNRCLDIMSLFLHFKVKITVLCTYTVVHPCTLVLFQNRNNVQDIAFLRNHSSVFYSLKGSIENRFFKFLHIFFFSKR